MMDKQIAEDLYDLQRKLIIEETIEDKDILFCYQSFDFVINHPTLGSAWDSCLIPEWMEWWMETIIDDWDSCNYMTLGTRPLVWGHMEWDKEKCNLYRSRVTYWGEIKCEHEWVEQEKDWPIKACWKCGSTRE